MRQQIDTTCQTPYIWATSMSYPTACKMWQNTRIHTHTHACECRRDIDHRDNPCQSGDIDSWWRLLLRRPPKNKGKQPYCLLRCTFTAPHFALLQRAPPKSEATQRTLHFYSALQCKSLCLAWLRPLTQPAHASGNCNHHAVMILTKHVHHAVRVWSWYHDTDKTRPSRCKSVIMISWYWLLMPSRCKSVSVFMLT